MLGVRPPIMPRWYALIFQIPTSSVMMTRMFGFRCCAEAGATIAVTATKSVRRLKKKFLVILMSGSPFAAAQNASVRLPPAHSSKYGTINPHGKAADDLVHPRPGIRTLRGSFLPRTEENTCEGGPHLQPLPRPIRLTW